jgi:hypothetical protein
MRLRIYITCEECHGPINDMIEIPEWPVVVRGECDNGHQYPYVHRTDGKGRLVMEYRRDDQGEAHERAA